MKGYNLFDDITPDDEEQNNKDSVEEDTEDEGCEDDEDEFEYEFDDNDFIAPDENEHDYSNPYFNENTRLIFKDGVVYSDIDFDPESDPVLEFSDNVRGIAQGAFYGNKIISEVIFPEGLEFVGMGAFSNCINIEKITIPKNVTRIGRNPFEECPSLQSIEVDPDNPGYCSVDGCLYDKDMTTLIAVPGAAERLEIPQGVSTIAARAAYACQKLAEVEIPESVTRIEDESFMGNVALQAIQLPSSLAYIGKCAFRFCSLKELVIPESVTEIGKRAFSDCQKLESAVIPEGIKRIEKGMFFRCSALKSVILPQSLEEIGDTAFFACIELSDINIPKSVRTIGFQAFDGTKLSDEYIILGDDILYKYCGKEKNVVIPDGIKVIGAAFNQSSLQTVIIPEGVVRIDDDAFSQCKRLSEVILPKSLKSIGRYTFSGCGSLPGIRLNEGLEEIGDFAFQNCKFKELALPDTLKRIGDKAFLGCSFSSIKIPTGVSHIGINPFEQCKPSIRIEIDEANPYYRMESGCVFTRDGKELKFALPGVTHVELPQGCTTIDESAFKWNISLTRVVIPDSVTEIGKDAFKGCGLFAANLPIAAWKSEYGCTEEEYALNYMRLYESGDPFFEENRDANNAFIRANCDALLRIINLKDTAMVRYMVNQGLLDVYSTDFCLQTYEGDIEMTAVLLDYKNSRFSREYLDALEAEEFKKDIGEKERTTEEWERVFSFGEERTDGRYITGYYGVKNDVLLPGHIGMLPVNNIAKYAFSPRGGNLSESVQTARKNIRSVIIPEGVFKIRAYAFYDCVNLSEVSLPEGLLIIETGAFKNCIRLTQITIPDSVFNIMPGAFENCNITIKGRKGSYGIAYAKHYGLRYEII